MKKILISNLIVLSLSLSVIAQKPKTAPASGATGQSLSVKDMEYIFTYNDDPIKFLATKGFKKGAVVNGSDADTISTANAKGDILLLTVSYQGLTGLLFKTSSSATIEKIMVGAARYQLADSIELVKTTGNENYLQKRYAYIEKGKVVLPSNMPPPPPDQAGSKFVFSLISPSVENGKKQYWLHFKKIISQDNANSIELSNAQRGVVEVSPEKYARFQADSIRVAGYIHPAKVNPIAPGLLSRMNQFLLEHIFNDQYLPIQFIQYSDVQSILITPNNEQERSFEYQFNTAGQLTAVSSGQQITGEVKEERRNNLFEDYTSFALTGKVPYGFDNRRYEIEYQQTVPVKAGDVSIDYNLDTVIAYNANWLRLYKMKNKTFFLVGEYQLSPASYNARTLSKDLQYELEEKEGKIYYNCIRREDGKVIFKRCYPATQGELPYEITEYSKSHGDYSLTYERYRKAQPGQLLRETSRGERFIYFIENFQLKGLDKCSVMYKNYKAE